jgi:1,4-dihydroxy-2-naphthoate octaprenyltransferase
MSRFKSVLAVMRAPFLLLTPACVLLGLGTAVWSGVPVSTEYFAITLVGALSAHISVNVLNEYFDYRSGLDRLTRRTPFSGGSGTLPAHPEMVSTALYIAVLSFAVTAAVGVYLIATQGVGLLPIGLLGLLIVCLYTGVINRSPLLCLVAPGLGFGPLMVLGVHYVLTGEYTWSAFVASLVPFFLVSNLLLLNQFPDVEADSSVGRRNLPVLLGRRASARVFGLFLLLAYLVIIFGVFLEHLPRATLVGLTTAVLAAPLFVGVQRHADDPARLVPYMALNVVVTVITPLMVSLGLLFG